MSFDFVEMLLFPRIANNKTPENLFCPWNIGARQQ